MANVIIVAVLAAIVGVAAWYVVKAKKSGRKCIGCPDGCCSKKNEGADCCCGCGGTNEKN